MKPKLLGTDPHGFTYWQHKDHYVYQHRPDGSMVGWICTVGVWESTMHTLLRGA